MRTVKVKSESKPSSVAGAIAEWIKNGEKVELISVGAGATNQSIKAVAILRGYVAPNGIDVICTPAFVELGTEEEKITGIKLIVERR